MNSVAHPLGLKPLKKQSVALPRQHNLGRLFLVRSVVRATPGPLVVKAAVSFPSEEASREDLGAGPLSNDASRQPTNMKGGGMGSFQGATIQKSKLSQKMEQKTSNPRLDDFGGGGNNGGKILGGGGGGDDGGDDDDYMNYDGEGDGEGEGNGWFRQTFPENYSREAIAAILSEWFKTIAGLPMWLRGLVEMGVFSSQQLARFFTLEMRPSVFRNISRSLPIDVQRELVGRLMADPAFLHKLIIDQGIVVTMSLIWEAAQRGPNFTKELDLVAANTASLALANGAACWLLAPSRSFGSAYKLPFQEMLANLPNNVFDKSTKHKAFTMSQRVSSALAKAAELSAVGAFAGAFQSAAGQGVVALRRSSDPSFSPSVPVAPVHQSALGMAAFMALGGNARHQLVNGLDRYAFERANILPVYLAVSAAARTVGQWVSQDLRLAAQGLPQGLNVVRRHRPALARPQANATAQKRVVRRVVKRKVQAPSESAAAGPSTSAAVGAMA